MSAHIQGKWRNISGFSGSASSRFSQRPLALRDCKSAYAGSIPARTSNKFKQIYPVMRLNLKQDQGAALDKLGAAAPDPHPGRDCKGSAFAGVQGQSPWSDNHPAAFISQHCLTPFLCPAATPMLSCAHAPRGAKRPMHVTAARYRSGDRAFPHGPR